MLQTPRGIGDTPGSPFCLTLKTGATPCSFHPHIPECRGWGKTKNPQHLYPSASFWIARGKTVREAVGSQSLRCNCCIICLSFVCLGSASCLAAHASSIPEAFALFVKIKDVSQGADLCMGHVSSS